MAQTSWPFENIDTSETQFSQWARNIGEGVKENALNELEVFADSTGMRVKVRSGQAMVRGHYYQSTAEEILIIGASSPTNPRIDNVVLELDPTANSIILKIVEGTPASSPSAPALTQTDGGIYQLKLAQVLVGTGVTTIAAGNVSDYRTYLTSGAELAADVAQLQSDITTLTVADIIDLTASAAEINVLDGMTASTAELNVLDGITASTAELNILDGVTASAAELNVLDGITASTTELNYTDGVTSAIQTQLDSKAPLTQPIEAKTGAYQLAIGDRGDLITCNGTFTITIPSATFSAGDRVDFINIGTGVITFAGSGVTINSVDSKVTINKRYAGATFFFTSASAGILIGNLA